MKVRNGFVSNSSSSSFIATYGMVVNKDVFDAWIKENNRAKEYKIITGDELWNLYNSDRSYELRGYDFFDCIDWKIIIKKAIENPTAMFVFRTGRGPDGDYAFMNEYEDIDYDIDLDRFQDVDIDLYKSTSDFNGVEVVSQTFYAGRDG